MSSRTLIPQRQARALLKRLTPGESVHREYRDRVARYLGEHEFVHVNQILLGMDLRAGAIVRARDAIDILVTRARAEYEASVLQLSRWPEVLRSDGGLGLDHWCAVRGWSQALERMFADIATQDVTPRRVTRALDMLRAELPSIIVRMGADGGLAPWFVERFDEHVALALSRVVQIVPGASDAGSIATAAGWVRRRCGRLWDEVSGRCAAKLASVRGRRARPDPEVPF